MAPKSMVWDATADRKLLLGILKLQNVTVDYEAMSKYMSADGTTCTVSAIQNRINRLKAQANKEGGVGSPGGVATPISMGKGSAKKRATTVTSDDDGETPSQKPKGKGGKTKTPAAVSDDEDDGEGGVESVIKAEEDADEDV